MITVDTHAIEALLAEYMRERQNGPRPVTSFSQETRAAFAAGARAVLAEQRTWPDLPVDEAVAELAKGEKSIFHPLFEDDPTVLFDCPRCGHETTVHADGLCSECGLEVAL